MAETLGAHLRALREESGLTLRDVEARCNLSNGYVSLLERDKVKEPSPRALWALARCYNADYFDLMRRAGYPLPGEMASARPAVAFRGAEHLTPEECEEIQRIIALKLELRRRRERQE